MGGGGEGGVVFQMGGFIFKWGVPIIGGISFDGGGFRKKLSNVGGKGGAPHAPPLWETLISHARLSRSLFL